MKMRLGFLIAAMALVWLLLAHTDDPRARSTDAQVSIVSS